MKNTIFDVMIVYSERLAISANSLSNNEPSPFAQNSKIEHYNAAYSYFLKTCQKNNLKAAFTTSADIIDAGSCKSYWLYENEMWKKTRKYGFSKIIFDKFSPKKTNGFKGKRTLLFSSGKAKPFNKSYINNLFRDKQKTNDRFQEFSIPTVTINSSTITGVENACKFLKEKIAQHHHNEDFSKKIIVKDKFGAGGQNVYKFKTNQVDEILTKLKQKYNVSFIIQPFVKFNKGFIYNSEFVSTDIRVIYLGQKIVQTYIRMAQKGEFRCNEHQGGILKYIPKNEMPKKVFLASNIIAKKLNAKSSLFALDFIISNNGNVYLLEANSGPGLDWNLNIRENEIEAKKLIRIIVQEVKKRINNEQNLPEEKIDALEKSIPSLDQFS